MSKTTSRSASASLSLLGTGSLDHPIIGAETTGKSEVEISVRTSRGGLRVVISTVVATAEGEDDAVMEFAADVDPAEFFELLGFERSIRAMSSVLTSNGASTEVYTHDDLVCAVERIYSDAVERFGMMRCADAQPRWERLIRGSHGCSR